MKLLGCFIFLSLSTMAQWPEIKSNVTYKEREESVIYNLFHKNYDFVLAYITESYWWSDKVSYQILAYRDKQWERITLYQRKKKNGKWTKPFPSHREIEESRVEKLISDLNDLSFWTLNRDSLNLQHKMESDSTSTMFWISDGVNEKFEILAGEEYRIIESYEPERYFQWNPEFKKREEFIKARKRIEGILKYR